MFQEVRLTASNKTGNPTSVFELHPMVSPIEIRKTVIVHHETGHSAVSLPPFLFTGSLFGFADACADIVN